MRRALISAAIFAGLGLASCEDSPGPLFIGSFDQTHDVAAKLENRDVMLGGYLFISTDKDTALGLASIGENPILFEDRKDYLSQDISKIFYLDQSAASMSSCAGEFISVIGRMQKHANGDVWLDDLTLSLDGNFASIYDPEDSEPKDISERDIYCGPLTP